MADPVLWPFEVLTPAALSFDANPRTLRGSSSPYGGSQVVVSTAGVWLAEYKTVPLHTPQQIKCWRALSALIEGRATPLLVPLWETNARLPLPSWADGAALTVPFGDDALFEYEVPFEQPTIYAEAAASASLYATQIQIRMLQGAAPEPGQHFSIGVRLYRIARIVSVSGNVSTLKIWPPLREAVASGAVAEFARPVCKMRLATDGELSAMLTMNRYTSADVAFVEDTL